MHHGTGVIQYGPGTRIVVWIDLEIANYYRSLIPKAYYVSPQKYRPHITVVRPKFEKIKNMKFWKAYNGKSISFTYEGKTYFDKTYFYLDVQSHEIGDIREELGLTRYRLSELGASRGCYHITIGNVKEQK